MSVYDHDQDLYGDDGAGEKIPCAIRPISLVLSVPSVSLYAQGYAGVDTQFGLPRLGGTGLESASNDW